MYFANMAMQVIKKDKIFHVIMEEVENKNKMLDLVAFNDVKRLIGISKVHKIKVMGPNKVEVSSYKGFLVSRLHSFTWNTLFYLFDVLLFIQYIK